MNLSELQKRLLDWIEEYIWRYGYPPARREIKAAMGYKTLSSIQNHLFALREQGYADWKKGKSRSIQVLRPRTARVPVVGAIAAHSLVETFPDEEIEYVDLSSLLQKRSCHEISQYFALRVRGDSMIGAAIDDGDLVVMKPSNDPKSIKDGTIVAARVEGKTTLKHHHRNGRAVILKPANPNYSPSQVDASNLDIQGVLVGVVRGFF